MNLDEIGEEISRWLNGINVSISSAYTQLVLSIIQVTKSNTLPIDSDTGNTSDDEMELDSDNERALEPPTVSTSLCMGLDPVGCASCMWLAYA